jgi:phosphoribosyl 1,2-cyclic phosphodiesterase
MSDNQQLPLSVQPVISYPREAQVGKTYLMTIDLQPSGDGEWFYEEEEYPIYCMLETLPLFSSKPVGEPAVVLHRFGGSYGAAKFLLTAVQEEMEGEIRVTLVNGWGVPVKVLNLSNIRVVQEISFTPQITEEEYEKEANLDSISQPSEVLTKRKHLDVYFPEESEVSITKNQFTVHFWGVRGCIVSPGSETVRYGGNTSCVEMRVGGHRLIFDGGTGLRVLGQALLTQIPLEAYIFFTHYHWSHIQGLPFFTPAFTEGNTLHIHGAAPGGTSMEQHFYYHVLHLNSPVPVREIQANLKFYDLVCGDTLTLDDITIETGPLNHPNGAMGYRVTWNGHSAFYCTDTEHFPDHLDENVLHLARDADLIIYDAMYTDEEYHNPKSPKVGWGHSTWQEAVKIAKQANVKMLVIFHHDPLHNDDFMDLVEQQTVQQFPNSVVAKEGMAINLIPTPTSTPESIQTEV